MNRKIILIIALFIGTFKIATATTYENRTESVTVNKNVLFKCWINSPEGLRLRTSSNLNSDIITVIKDKQEVEVLEIGSIDKIDNKLAFWLKVKNKSNIGWVFGAYVSIVPKTIQENSYDKEVAFSSENLIGNWFSGYTEDSFYLEQSSFYVTFAENNLYRCGKNFTGIGARGNFTLSDNKIKLNLTITEDHEQIEYAEELEIKKLTETTLIYTKDSEEFELHRFPKTVLELKNKSDIEWIKYINQYGNQEFYNGADLFMYAIVNHKYEVALFLFNSNLMIRKSPYIHFPYADLFITEQDLKKRKTEIYQYLLNEILKKENT